MIKIIIINTALKDKFFEISTAKPFIIGREKDCDLRIPFSVDNSISRKHCKINIIDNKLIIEDLKSSNGVYVNNLKIEDKIEIFNKNIIKIGSVEMLIESDLETKCRNCSKFLSKDEINIDKEKKILCIDCFSSLQTIEIKTDEKIKNLLSERKTNKIVSDIEKIETINPIDNSQALPEKPISKTEIESNESLSNFTTYSQINSQELLEKPITKTENNESLSNFTTFSPINSQALPDKPITKTAFPLDKTIMMLDDDFQELNNCFDLNNHVILKELGKGEVGTVFLAQNNITFALVAIKILHTHLTGIESNRIFLLSKINRFKQLSHDNIAHFITSQQQGDRILTISEFCNQGNLVDYIISNNGKLDISESIKITCEILEGLKYAHNYKHYLEKKENLIIHGNIKPSNILFSKRANKVIAKLSDFGMSSILDFAGVSSCTKHAPTANDLFFTSRKQVIDFDCCDKSIDIWSVMACLYYMLTGKSPRNFIANSDPYSIILRNPPMPIRQRNSKIPKELADIIDKALDDTKDELLYSKPDEILDILKEIKL